MPRLILSRKGFDSGSGGGPSPRLPDGRLVSLPIPDPGSPIAYADAYHDGGTYLDLLKSVGIDSVRDRGKSFAVDETLGAHLDPDTISTQRPRPPGWRPTLGQLGNAQSHLRDNAVGVGDLFLFFGLFRDTKNIPGGLRFVGPEYHALWGWLEVGNVVQATAAPPWASQHPHVAARHLPRYEKGDNVLYVAADSCQWAPGLPAAGLLAGENVRLTTPGMTASNWTVPVALHPDRAGAFLTHHPGTERWKIIDRQATLRSARRGQEFVITATSELRDWAKSLLASAAI